MASSKTSNTQPPAGEDELIPNKIANSGLVTLDLADFYPSGLRLELDIAPWLYEGVMLREKDFRAAVKAHDWSQYQNAYVAVYCSEDAIVPQWAYLLLAASLTPFARRVVHGPREVLESLLMDEAIARADIQAYQNKRVIVKGCGDLPIPAHAYVALTSRLQPVVRSLMFGEACSTVPVYKAKKNQG